MIDSALAECCLPPSGTLLDAMRSLERSGRKIVLIVSEDGRLLATLTDGDIRRAQLSGATLASPAMPAAAKSFFSIRASASRVEVLELMQAKSIEQVPVLDDDGMLVGLHLLHEILATRPRDNAAVIMAGGQGTRLRPLTETIPKPMIRVAGRPILERIVLHLTGFGVRKIYIAINYLGDVIERHFGNGSGVGCSIEYLRETEPLGTAGALSLLPVKPERSIVVLNGDLVTQADIGRMLDQHETGGHALTVGTYPYTHVIPYGCVDLNGTEVLRIREKPQVVQTVNAGIYIVRPDLLAWVPSGAPMTMPGLIEAALAREEQVHAFEIQGEWHDIGQREQLMIARGEV